MRFVDNVDCTREVQTRFRGFYLERQISISRPQATMPTKVGARRPSIKPSKKELTWN